MLVVIHCTDSLNCNKRISCAGPERSAGRPGHTPTRRTFACEKLVEDSCAGPDWSAGRPGTMPFGASSAACPSSQTACIGPYGTAATQQLYTGHNTRTEQFVTQSSSARLPRPEDRSTSQQQASSSRGNAAEENASLAKVALHPRRPPYFVGGIDDDVYVWTSIVDRWLDTVLGRALTAVDIHCVIAKRSRLRMVHALRDAYWVSRRLDNVASSLAGALWDVDPCRKGTCWFIPA